jgi:hypothetical protein
LAATPQVLQQETLAQQPARVIFHPPQHLFQGLQILAVAVRGLHRPPNTLRGRLIAAHQVGQAGATGCLVRTLRRTRRRRIGRAGPLARILRICTVRRTLGVLGHRVPGAAPAVVCLVAPIVAPGILLRVRARRSRLATVLRLVFGRLVCRVRALCRVRGLICVALPIGRLAAVRPVLSAVPRRRLRPVPRLARGIRLTAVGGLVGGLLLCLVLPALLVVSLARFAGGVRLIDRLPLPGRGLALLAMALAGGVLALLVTLRIARLAGLILLGSAGPGLRRVGTAAGTALLLLARLRVAAAGLFGRLLTGVLLALAGLPALVGRVVLLPLLGLLPGFAALRRLPLLLLLLRLLLIL